MTNFANTSFEIGLRPFINIGFSYSPELKNLSKGEEKYQGNIDLLVSDATITHWNEILSRFNEIYDEVFNEEFQPPTELAAQNTQSLLHKAFSKLGLKLPVPNFIPTDLSGIEAEWKNGNRYLQLICPPTDDKKPYLFFKEGVEYDIEPFENSDDFIKRIAWLIEN
ncbi:MAG: hypothetical protein M3525_10240 [Acidobacteriota bacterium]|jgi:hypothetical protein|nr:hypothetical protein [Acidobacteriota bacterium]